MGRERKVTILKKNGKIYARIRFKDENGKIRDIWKKADNQKHAKEVIKILLKEIITERHRNCRLKNE